VSWKDKKEFYRDMKDIYAAPTQQAALAALENLELKWNSIYSFAIKGWRQNWDELTVLFDFPLDIR
jgi:putative transposase